MTAIGIDDLVLDVTEASRIDSETEMIARLGNILGQRPCTVAEFQQAIGRKFVIASCQARQGPWRQVQHTHSRLTNHKCHDQTAQQTQSLVQSSTSPGRQLFALQRCTPTVNLTCRPVS